MRLAATHTRTALLCLAASALIAIAAACGTGSSSGLASTFVYIGDSVVRDTLTGLDWQNNPPAGTGTWQDARNYCSGLDQGGKTDWRVPERRELLSIVNYAYRNPAADLTFFNVLESGHYWAETTDAFYLTRAWAVDFADGGVDALPMASAAHAVCVRGTPLTAPALAAIGNRVSDATSGLAWQATDDNIQRTWSAAYAYCAALTLDAFTGWRLPTARELAALPDTSRAFPALPEPPFTGTDYLGGAAYWASTQKAYDPSGAWTVEFGLGMANTTDVLSTRLTRCVR